MAIYKIAGYTGEKTASDYLDLVPPDIAKRFLVNTLVGAGTGTVVNALKYPQSERDLTSAAIRGALFGGLTTPNTMYHKDLGGGAIIAGLGGGIFSGLTTPSMTDGFIKDEKRLEELNRNLKSPFLSDRTRRSIQGEIDAIMEKRQEDIQSKFGSYINE